MKRGKRLGPEVIIPKLREAEVLLAKGLSTAKVCRQLGVSENTYYRWRKEYGGLRLDQAKRLKDLEKENARLKGDLSKDARANFQAALEYFEARRQEAE